MASVLLGLAVALVSVLLVIALCLTGFVCLVHFDVMRYGCCCCPRATPYLYPPRAERALRAGERITEAVLIDAADDTDLNLDAAGPERPPPAIVADIDL